MSDYAAIVARDDFSHKLLDVGRKPYWATNSADGRYCFVSASGDDRVAVISYADERIVATIGVGDHPQRMRTGVMRAEYLPPVADRDPPRIAGARVLRGVLALRLSEDARLRAVVQRARGGRWRTVRTVERDLRAGSRRVRLGALRDRRTPPRPRQRRRRRRQPLRARRRPVRRDLPASPMSSPGYSR